MKMRLLSFCACVLAALAAFTAQADVKLTYQEKYGDHMGTSSACQAKNYYMLCPTFFQKFPHTTKEIRFCRKFVQFYKAF